MGDMRRGKETRHCWEWVICGEARRQGTVGNG